MSDTIRRNLLYIVATLGLVGILFNLFQGVVIIAGGYNRNPNIDSELLQILDSVALTGLWLLVSVVMVFGAIRTLRQQN